MLSIDDCLQHVSILRPCMNTPDFLWIFLTDIILTWPHRTPSTALNYPGLLKEASLIVGHDCQKNWPQSCQRKVQFYLFTKLASQKSTWGA